jgi:hypothetical protein
VPEQTIRDVARTVIEKLDPWVNVYARQKGQAVVARSELHHIVNGLILDQIEVFSETFHTEQAKKNALSEAVTSQLRKQLELERETVMSFHRHVQDLRRYVGLAVRVLQRSRREKKKSSALRAALGTLEAALSDPAPARPLSAMLEGGVVSIGWGALLLGWPILLALSSTGYKMHKGHPWAG